MSATGLASQGTTRRVSVSFSPVIGFLPASVTPKSDFAHSFFVRRRKTYVGCLFTSFGASGVTAVPFTVADVISTSSLATVTRSGGALPRAVTRSARMDAAEGRRVLQPGLLGERRRRETHEQRRRDQRLHAPSMEPPVRTTASPNESGRSGEREISW